MHRCLEDGGYGRVFSCVGEECGDLGDLELSDVAFVNVSCVDEDCTTCVFVCVVFVGGGSGFQL